MTRGIDVAPEHTVLFTTDRGLRHQQAALAAAPPELVITVLRRPSRDQMLAHLPSAEFLISERMGRIDGAIIAAAPQLRLIQRLGSLTYDIDLAAARSAGIPVSAWPVHSCIMVAEHMILQLLTLIKRVQESAAVARAAKSWPTPSRRTDEDTFAYDWSGRQGIDQLYGKTVGIVGFGEIGAELARRLRCFRPGRVLYHKRRRLPPGAEAELHLVYATVGELTAESHVLCNLLPFSPDTDHLIDAAFLADIRRGAYLVSCGSGSVIDEHALADALRSGHLAGAALDTFEWEPVRPDNPLLPLARDPAANVLLTPHVAAGGGQVPPGTQARSEDFINVLRVLRGESLLYRVA
jgi:lactate dehydrogenase-like 2-hydroxyacid dehydrogenase